MGAVSSPGNGVVVAAHVYVSVFHGFSRRNELRVVTSLFATCITRKKDGVLQSSQLAIVTQG